MSMDSIGLLALEQLLHCDSNMGFFMHFKGFMECYSISGV
jgi:hypothetical protein